MKTDKIILEIEKNKTNVKIFSNSEAINHSSLVKKLEFNINALDLSDIFAKVNIETPFLPRYTVYYEKQGDDSLVVLGIPAHIAEVLYKPDKSKPHTVKYQVPIPYTGWVIGLSDNRNDNHRISRVFAMDCPIIGKKDRVFKFPLPNVWDKGDICFGGNCPKIHSLTEAWVVPHHYFSSIMNSDLNPPWKHSFKRSTAWQEFFKDIDGKKFFPSKYLVSTERTVGSIIKDVQES